MANTLKAESVQLGKGEHIFRLADIEAARKKAEMEGTTFKDPLEDYYKVGANHGTPFTVKVGETFTFPPMEEFFIIQRISEISKDKSTDILLVGAESSLRGPLEVPVALFRRSPALAEHRDWLEEDDNSFGRVISLRQYADYNRAYMLVGKTIKCTDSEDLPRVTFSKKEDGSRYPDTEPYIRERAEQNLAPLMAFYKWEEVSSEDSEENEE